MSNEGRSGSPAMSHLKLFLELADPGFYYLQNHGWTEITENDFAACLIIGKMILKTTMLDPTVIPRLIEQTTEVWGCSSLSFSD